tara:strand:- start:479 stop:754 length:276 start_codon:yes stop_codon:yes gene_type:complete
MSEKNKRTRSFRIDDSLWAIVDQTAVEQNKKPSEIIIAALVHYVGDIIRHDRKLSAKQIVSILGKIDKMTKELERINKTIGNYEPENTSSG